MDYDEFLSREDAVDRVLTLRQAAFDLASIEPVPIDQIAGRTLAEAVVSEDDLPAHSHATMDGFAFDASESGPFQLVDEVFPEDEAPQIGPGEAVRIATGAPLPNGANAVLKREDAVVEEGVLSDSTEDGQSLTATIEPGTYVYGRGTNVAAGETLFEAGERLSAKDAILLRDLGVEEVRVHEPLSVGILATGTEIHEGRSSDLDSPMLAGLVRSWGHEPTYEGTVPDEYELVEERISELAEQYDVVFTTGGTSVGKKDYAVRALDALGEVHFHNVRIRPGKPIAVASFLDHGATAFAIPGKPVGAYTISTAVVRPFFTGDGSLPGFEAELDRTVGIGREGFEYWVPVTLDGNADGSDMPLAKPLGHADSPLAVYEETFNPSVLSSSTRATRADGFFVTESGVEAGESVHVVPYSAVE